MATTTRCGSIRDPRRLINANDGGATISVDDIVAAVSNRPRHVNVIITGRDAARELIDLADTVTEMREVKHAYQQGIRAMRGIDEVHHLAYVNGTATFYSAPEFVLDVGVKGIVNVIDGCRRWNVGRLVLASSSEVYQSPPQVPTDESVPLVVPDPEAELVPLGATALGLPDVDAGRVVGKINDDPPFAACTTAHVIS